MYKALGVVCIMAGCVGFGSGRISREKDRVAHLRTLFYILGQMRSEIAYGKHTLPEICLLLAKLNDERYTICFTNIYDRSAKESGVSFPKVWKEEMGSCLEKLPLREDEKQTMAELAKHLNFQDETGQAGRIERVETFFEERCRQAQEACENRLKMIRSVSILAGLLLAIMLL